MYRPTAFAGLLTLLTALPSSGQQTVAELQRQVDSLAPLMQQAAVEAERVWAARREEALERAAAARSLDTLQVAGLRIIALRPDAEEARQLFGEVLAEGLSGVDIGALSGGTFTYQRSSYDEDDILVSGTHRQIVVSGWLSRADAKERIRSALGMALVATAADTRVAGWMLGNPFTSVDPERMYREAVLAGSVAVERCLDGSTGSCLSSLGLGLDDDVLDEWYTPEQRRARVFAKAGYAGRPGDAVSTRAGRLYGSTFESCAELRSPNACDVFIDHDRTPDWAPLPIYMRATLVALALERGGPGGWARLVEDPRMSPEEALPYAAGTPLDDLVFEWRERVVTSRRESYAGIGGKSALALLWIIFFAAAATRSTRWRFA